MQPYIAEHRIRDESYDQLIRGGSIILFFVGVLCLIALAEEPARWLFHGTLVALAVVGGIVLLRFIPHWIKMRRWRRAFILRYPDVHYVSLRAAWGNVQYLGKDHWPSFEDFAFNVARIDAVQEASTRRDHAALAAYSRERGLPA